MLRLLLFFAALKLIHTLKVECGGKGSAIKSGDGKWICQCNQNWTVSNRTGSCTTCDIGYGPYPRIHIIQSDALKVTLEQQHLLDKLSIDLPPDGLGDPTDERMVERYVNGQHILRYRPKGKSNGYWEYTDGTNTFISEDINHFDVWQSVWAEFTFVPSQLPCGSRGYNASAMSNNVYAPCSNLGTLVNEGCECNENGYDPGTFCATCRPNFKLGDEINGYCKECNDGYSGTYCDTLV